MSPHTSELTKKEKCLLIPSCFANEAVPLVIIPKQYP